MESSSVEASSNIFINKQIIHTDMTSLRGVSPEQQASAVACFYTKKILRTVEGTKWLVYLTRSCSRICRGEHVAQHMILGISVFTCIINTVNILEYIYFTKYKPERASSKPFEIGSGCNISANLSKCQHREQIYYRQVYTWKYLRANSIELLQFHTICPYDHWCKSQ